MADLGRFSVRGEALPLPEVRSGRLGLFARLGFVRGLEGGDLQKPPALLDGGCWLLGSRSEGRRGEAPRGS